MEDLLVLSLLFWKLFYILLLQSKHYYGLQPVALQQTNMYKLRHIPWLQYARVCIVGLHVHSFRLLEVISLVTAEECHSALNLVSGSNPGLGDLAKWNVSLPAFWKCKAMSVFVL